MEEQIRFWAVTCLFVVFLVLFVCGSMAKDESARTGYFLSAAGFGQWWAMTTGESFPMALQSVVLICCALPVALPKLPDPARVGVVAVSVLTAKLWLTSQIKLDALGWVTVLCVGTLGLGFATQKPRVIFGAASLLVLQSIWAGQSLGWGQVSIGYLLLNGFMAWNLRHAVKE